MIVSCSDHHYNRLYAAGCALDFCMKPPSMGEAALMTPVCKQTGVINAASFREVVLLEFTNNGTDDTTSNGKSNDLCNPVKDPFLWTSSPLSSRHSWFLPIESD